MYHFSIDKEKYTPFQEDKYDQTEEKKNQTKIKSQK